MGKISQQQQATWNPPERLAGAFIFLAGLRGSVQGCRFDAAKLTEALADEGRTGTQDHITALDESKNA